jgi:O-antigen/teichoic acid export membrane protein
MTNKIRWWIKNNKALLVNAGSLIGSTGVTSVLGFAYWWFAARQNAPAVVGLASAAISAMTLLGTLSMLGLGTLLIGELPRRKGKEASLISAALILVGGVGACAGILYAFIASSFSAGFRPLGANLGDVLLFASGVSLTAITLVLDEALIGLLRGELQLWRNIVFTSVKLAALFAADLWLAHVTGLTIYATLVIGNLASLAVLALFIIFRHPKALKRAWPEWTLLRQIGSEALKHHSLNILLQMPALVLPVLVTIMLSSTVNAWFYVSWNLSSIANTIVAALVATLYAVSSAQPSALAAKLRLTLSLSCAGCLIVNGILIVVPGQALAFFGHSYAVEASWSLRLLAIESFPFIIKGHFIALARIRRHVGRTIFIVLVTGLLELGASIAGARIGGLNGLSLGWLLAMCLEAICMTPTVYAVARTSREVQRAGSGEREEAWQQNTMKLMPEQRSLGAEAVWLLDTLAMTAIGPGLMEAETMRLRALQLQRNEDVPRRPRNEKMRLRPTRLEHIVSYEQEGEEAYQENNYAEYDL